MKKDSTDKKVDNSLNDNELMNVTGGISSCYDYNNQADCESNNNCAWNSKSDSCKSLVIW